VLKKMDYAEEALNGNKLAAGRIIKMVEDNEATGFETIKHLYPYTGNAFVIGITGPPGAGKSTLIDCLIAAFRKNQKKVAVLAIDPSSPITGGALLGDRIRMKRHYLDPGVFIRSIATRGALGGVSWSTKGALIVLDAMKYDVIFIETAGVGQLGADISLLVQMTLVLCIPGMGDALQALKAGTLEIADLFIVNKADRPDTDEVVNHLENMINLREGGWHGHPPRIIKTTAVENKGIDDVVSEIDRYRYYIKDNDHSMESMFEREYRFFRFLIKELAADKIWRHLEGLKEFKMSIDKLKKRQEDPYSIAHKIINELIKMP
jgi:GTPase